MLGYSIHVRERKYGGVVDGERYKLEACMGQSLVAKERQIGAVGW